MQTAGRGKAEQMRQMNNSIKSNIIERAEWPASSSRSWGPEQPGGTMAGPWPWPSPWHGPLQPARSDGVACASTPSRGSHLARSRHPAPPTTCHTTTPKGADTHQLVDQISAPPSPPLRLLCSLPCPIYATSDQRTSTASAKLHCVMGGHLDLWRSHHCVHWLG